MDKSNIQEIFEKFEAMGLGSLVKGFDTGKPPSLCNGFDIGWKENKSTHEWSIDVETPGAYQGNLEASEDGGFVVLTWKRFKPEPQESITKSVRVYIGHDYATVGVEVEHGISTIRIKANKQASKIPVTSKK